MPVPAADAGPLPALSLEDAQCPLGCTAPAATVCTAPDRLHGMPGRFTVVRCTDCGLMRTSPRPPEARMHHFYPEQYQPYVGTRTDHSAVRQRQRLWRRLVRGVFRFRTQCAPPLPPGRLLDVGCASGDYLLRMAAKGWDVTGIEPSAHAARHARSLGLAVHEGAPQTAPPPPAPYDLITAWMVLEHCHHPVDTLRLLHQWAAPEGMMALSVPNAGALEFRLFKDAWFALQLPTHLFHFTPQSITRVLQAGGWRVQRIMHQRTLVNVLGSMGNHLVERESTAAIGRALLARTNAPGILNHALYPVAAVAALFGQTGRMTVWAQREDD